MDDRDRIIAAFDRSIHTREQMAAALRISVPSLGRLLRRQRRLTAVERQAAFDFLSLDGANATPIKEVPIIGMISAGAWEEAIQDPIGLTYTTKLGDNLFALQVDGDSMDKIAPPGASVVIDPDDRHLREGKSYAVIREDGSATFKRFRSEPARLEPVSNNPTHRVIEIGYENFTVIGRAIEVTREL